MYQKDYLNIAEDEVKVIAFVIIVFVIIFIFLFLRNFWNMIQKRRFKSKFKNLSLEYDILKNSNRLLEQSKSQLTSKYRELQSINNEIITKKEGFKKKIENFEHERHFFNEKIKHTKVQASNNRLGAHFLKNVLNKIQEEYKEQTLSKFDLFGKSFIIEKKDKKKLLPENILIKLNALLDYMVSTINTSSIDINDEIIHVKIFLEIIKYIKPNLALTNNLKKNYSKTMVSPTLLFPFLENALKHGDLNNNDSFLSIDFVILKNKVSYEVRNSSININEKENNQGFGLESLENALSTYYKDYDLEFREDNNEFISSLTVEI